MTGDFTLDGTAYNSSMLTEIFALSGSDVFITGVAYHDQDDDDFYSIGEGQGDVTFSLGATAEITVQTGGYQIALSPQEAAHVTINVAGIQVATVQLDVTDGNGKLDLVTDADGAMSLSLSVDATLLDGVGDAALLGAGNISLQGHAGANHLTGNSGDN